MCGSDPGRHASPELLLILTQTESNQVNKHLCWLGFASLAMAASCPTPAATMKQAKWGEQDLAIKSCSSVRTPDAAFVTLGKASVIPLPSPVTRIIVNGQPASGAAAGTQPQTLDDKVAPGVGDMEVLLLSPTDLFFRGKKAGSTNALLQDTQGNCLIQEIIVAIDPAGLQAKASELLPGEPGIRVKSAENAIVLTGSVQDASSVDEMIRLAGAYGDGKRIVNLLRVTTPQQVMLEVKIAEVSKTLLDKFGIDTARLFTSADGLTSTVLSGIFGGGPALFGKFSQNLAGGLVTGAAAGEVGAGSAGASAALKTLGRGATLVGVDAQKKDGLVRVLAEPNIMAISGQSASFLSGGKIFIPVAQSREGGGGMVVTLEEKEFGVGLKFSPTVLNGSRVNLKLVSEVSELSQTGSPFTTVNGVTSVLPSIATRRVDTTVQLNDGQSFAVAGLIRNNITETLKRFPGLGELPVIGALFRSSEFQKDETELVFIVTPRLVKPLPGGGTLPTDHHGEPSRAGVLLMGRAEGNPQPAKQGDKDE